MKLTIEMSAAELLAIQSELNAPTKVADLAEDVTKVAKDATPRPVKIGKQPGSDLDSLISTFLRDMT